MQFTNPIVYIFIVHACLTVAIQVTAGAGQVSSSQNQTSCQDVQEFACNNDTCDPCAGPNDGGRCRNGGSSSDCQPGQLCNTPDPGHCLENTWCTSGNHTMPTLGTPKHFRCLSVTGLSPGQVVIMYQNNDYTGVSCMINGNGVWASVNDQLFNSVNSAPTSGQFDLCRQAGQSNGGQQALPIPGSVCQAHPELNTTDVCAWVGTGFPDINNTYWYELNTRPIPSKRDLRRRGNNFRLSASETRAIAALSGILVMIRQLIGGVPSGSLEVIDNSHAQSDYQFTTGATIHAWAGDHFFELQIITSFFQTNPGNGQWAFIWNNMQNCQEDYTLFSGILNSPCNLIGVATRVNNLKGLLFQRTAAGNAIRILWTTWYREELQALQNYLAYFRPRFDATVARLAAAMDTIWYGNGAPGASNAATPGQTFAAYANGLFDGALGVLAGALADGSVVFRSSLGWGNTYQHDELR